MNSARVMTLLGSIGLIVGALMPWVSANSMFGKLSKTGIEGDGIITAGIGVILLLTALLAKGKPGNIYSWAASLFGIIAICLLYYDYSNVSAAVSGIESDLMIASIGSGLYVSFLGALLAIIGDIIKIPALPPTYPLPSDPQSPTSI
ncbi:MAG TPA: hypothetical protein VF359_04620 [Anaerolineales bacterium]